MTILNLTFSIKNWKSKVQFVKSAMNILTLTFSIKKWKSKVQNDHFWWSRNRPLLWEASEIPPRLVIQSVHISGSFYLIFKDDFKKGNVYRKMFFGFFDQIFKYFFGRFSRISNVWRQDRTLFYLFSKKEFKNSSIQLKNDWSKIAKFSVIFLYWKEGELVGDRLRPYEQLGPQPKYHSQQLEE